ncbi:MAG: lipopolysaccharide heptosyltransferase II [Gammaproteobacteria bacterium]
MPSADATLVVGPAWVGDMVMAQSLFMSLKASAPDAAIDVVAPGWSAPLLGRMPQVRAAHTLQAGHGELRLGDRRALGRSLRGQYARAIVLPRSLKAALVPFFARVPERVGYLGEWRYGLLTDWRALDKQKMPTTVGRYVALGLEPQRELPSALPEPALDKDAAATTRVLQQLNLDTSGRVVALLPGAEYGPAEQWPETPFAALPARLISLGCAVWVLGSKKEHALGETICGDSGARNLCGQTSLTDVIDLLHCCDSAVSNDSGLMHVAAACGARVVALYGSSSPTMTPPLTERASIVTEPQPCSPCFARTCRYGHYDCLTKISVDRVFGEIENTSLRR